METTLQVQVDKTHITTIGERLYGESLELIRELVSNAYDADATRVFIELDEKEIRVKDDGTGMDEAGLSEYFNIGSPSKKFSAITQKYRRMKIGQFGIGKFAVLSACDRFMVYTQRNGYAAEVTFDKKEWRESHEWRVPVRKVDFSPVMGNGTVIKLKALKKQFTLPEVERFVRERLPLSAPHFSVYLNGRKVEPVYIAGTRFPVAAETAFGMITGECVAPNFRNRADGNKTGIECAVHGVVIGREKFGMETSPLFAVHKLTGRISADFLPITSDRGRFITDSLEYKAFAPAMERELKKIARYLGEEAVKKSNQKADEILKETMVGLGRAVRRNPAIAPKVMAPTGEIDPHAEYLNSLAPATTMNDPEGIDALKITIRRGGNEEGAPPFPDSAGPSGAAKAEKIKVKNLAGKMMVARRIKVGELGIVCHINRYGKEESPVFTEAGMIHINQDHPLYKKQEQKGRENLSFYLAYLLSQQIALMFAENDPRKAFEIQNKLLTDSF